MLAKLVLRQEMELQTIRAQDSYVFHILVDKEGVLQLLLDQGVAWGQMEPKPVPLRVHLFRELASELQKRFTVVSQTKPGTDTWKQLIERKIILPDGSWPKLAWSHQDQRYNLANTNSISMQNMQNLVQDLVDMGTEPHRIIRFFAMQQPTESRTTVAWKLQVHLRSDHAHSILTNLENSTLWTLLGAMMKSHRPGPSGLSQQISSCLGNSRSPKGKGKGKNKNGGKSKPKETS